MRATQAAWWLLLLLATSAVANAADQPPPAADIPNISGAVSPDEIIKRYPDDPRGYVLAANLAMRKCELAASEQLIREAMARAQAHPAFTKNTKLHLAMRRMLAGLFAMSGQYDKALAEENTLVEADPANTEFLYMRTQAYVQLQELEKALADADKIIELDRTYFKAWQIKAFAQYRLRRFADAIATYTTITENTEDVPAIVIGMRGQAYAATGQYSLALKDYDAALALARRQRAGGYSDEVVEDEITLKRITAETARKAEEAAPQDATRIRAEVFEKDQKSILPTNSLRCATP